MVLNTTDLKNACSKILAAIDQTGDAILVGRLELKTDNNILYFNVTNGDYFVSIKLGKCDEDFYATINADLFLKLISKVTDEQIEIIADETTLYAKTPSSKYKFALIYDGDEILRLPEIHINNVTTQMDIDSEILHSILIHNSKELLRGIKVAHDVQNFYYVDEQGAITYISSACINKFNLEKPVKMLLPHKIVKMFSLFKDGSVHFAMGYDAINEETMQTKVKFCNDDVCITSILSTTDNDIKAFHAKELRQAAFNEYSYAATLNKNQFLAAVQRVLLFASSIRGCDTCGKLTFKKSNCDITNFSKDIGDGVKYANELPQDLEYEAIVDLKDIQVSLEKIKDEYITIGFGDRASLVVAKGNIYTVIPEIQEI